ncbi:MAG: T9SS type A sorting domain-containing protein [Spirosomataceae bacterium]
MPSNSVCAGTVVSLTASGGDSYGWSNTGGGTFESSTNPATFSSNVAGGYSFSVTVTNAASCTASTSVSVTVNTQPTASISVPIGPLCTGKTINLSAPSGYGSYSWNYSPNNGNFASELHNATFSTTTGGSYAFSVTVASGTCTATATATAQVNTSPTASIALPSNSVCAGTSVSLNASGGDSYSWANAGGGSFVSSTNPATFSSNVAGGYSFSVTAINSASCTASASTSVTVNALPSVNINLSSATVCVGTQVGLSATNGYSSYSWNFSGGVFNSTTRQATFNSSSPGTFSFTVTVTNSNTCTATASATISVSSGITANISASASSVCQGNSINLSATGGNSFAWGATGGTFTNSSASPTQWSSTTAGNYSITVTASSGNCTVTSTTSVVVNSKPSAVLNAPSAVCLGNPINLTASGGGSYSWAGSSGGSFTSTTNPATFTTSTPNTYTFTVTVNDGTCTASVTATTSVINPPSAAISKSGSLVCAGTSISLSAPGGSTYTWSASGGAFSSTTGTPTNWSATAANTYTITLTAGGGQCTATATTTVQTKASPNLVANSNYTPNLCAGQPIQLSASAVTGGSYSWRGPSNFSSTVQNPTQTGSVLNNGIYSVTVTASNGCTASATVTGGVFGAIASANAPAVCTGSTLKLYAAPAATYSWSGPLNFSSTQQNPEVSNVQLTNGGFYTLRVTQGLCVAMTLIQVMIAQTPDASFKVSTSNGGPICTGSTVILKANSVSGTYSWSNPNVPPSQVSSNQVTITNFSAAKTGNYTLKVANISCSATTTQNIQLTCAPRLASEEDATMNMELNAYPNPVSKTMTVEVKMAKPSSLKLNLYNAAGGIVSTWQLSEEKTIHKAELDLSAYREGLYLIQAQSQSGKVTKRILKSNE